MDKQIETIFGEIMEAIDKGVVNAKDRITNKTKDLSFREALFCAGEVFTGEIGKAICEVFKKYMEEVK